MGDSTCLMQPFCYASGITNESNQGNPINALGESISFGRFMSESLAWEKWSSFSHNRYVEEAERYSRPGSVAQKKAFFEAHYKKLAAKKAAALLEQANNAVAETNNVTTREEDEGVVVDNIQNSETTSSTNSEVVVKEEKDEEVLNLNNVHDSSITPDQSSKVEECEAMMEKQGLIGNSMEVELQNQVEDVDANKEQIEKVNGTQPPIMTPIVKDSSSDEEALALMSKKKPPVSSFKLLKTNGTSKFISTPVKSTAPLSSKRDNIATPKSNKPSALRFGDHKRSTNIASPKSNNKPSTSSFVDHRRSTPICSSKRDNIATPKSNKRPTPKSLQMSVSFTPIRELNRLTASMMRKFESTRVGLASSKTPKDSFTPPRTPTTMTSKKERQRHCSLTPLTEKKRSKTPIDLSAGPKCHLLSAEIKMRSPVISSPFSLKTEERAARRKKKLEEKLNANEEQKVLLHTKLREKAETEIRKLRQSFCFKARPLPDFYKERKSSNIETKKNPVTHCESLKEVRNPTLNVVESKTCLPPHNPSLKNNGNKGKCGRTLAYHLRSNSDMITSHENTSPNILQHGNQNDISYK